MATYAVGDVQGCFAELEALLDMAGFSADDRLWLVGDLVNRGPRSLDVLRYVKSLGDRAITVLGNHDLNLVAVAAGVARPGRGDTLDEILSAPDKIELIDWLRTRPLAHVDGDHLMVHAGLLPQWSASDTLRLADEVESVLASAAHASFLSQMYGNHPARWDESLAGVDRLRAIVNVMTRMRFCTPDGDIELKEKGGLARTPKAYFPWFDAPGRKTAGLTVVCGHWSTLGYLARPDLLALDSGCVWGGNLTAVRLDDRHVFQLGCAERASPKRPQ